MAVLGGALALAAGACTSADPGVVEVSGPSSTGGDADGTGDSDGGGGVGAGLGDVAQEATASFLASSAERTAALDTGTITMSMTVSDNPTLGPGEVTVFSVDGAFDVPADASRFAIDLSGMLELDPSMLGDDSDPGGAGPDAAFEELMASVFAEPFEMIQIGEVAYLRLPGFGAFFGTDKEWFSSAAEGESLTDSFEGLAPSDLADTLGPLEDAGEVTEVGREEVGGADTTHYTVEVDPSAGSTGGAGGAAGALLGEFGSLGATLDVWIDDEGLIRRIEAVGDAADFDGEDLAPGLDEGTITFVLEFGGLGEPADIEPPPADEVFDLDGPPGSGLGPGGGRSPGGTIDPDDGFGSNGGSGSMGGSGPDETFITTTTVLGGGGTNGGDGWER